MATSYKPMKPKNLKFLNLKFQVLEMATSYKSMKPKNLKFSVLWIFGFDNLQVTKIQKTNGTQGTGSS